MRARVLVAVAVGLCLVGGAAVALGQPLIGGDEPGVSKFEPVNAAVRVAVTPSEKGRDPQKLGPGAAAAKSTVQRLAQESAVVLAQRPAKSSNQVEAGRLDDFAMGSALEEIIAQAEYNAREKWVQSGQPKVVWAKVDPAKSNTTTMAASVCLDSSDVVLRDATGKTLPPGPHPRTINLYEFRKQGGTWKVAAHSFPTKPDC